ncbi:MAG: T9SS type A sorting domain-containing protein, partial [Candidatus Cloacimonadota bacterium]
YASPKIGADGVIYAGASNLYAIEDSVTFGYLKWEITFSGGINSAPAIGPDSVIYVFTNSGILHAIGEAPTAIEISFFMAQVNQRGVVLRWRTESESNSALWYVCKRNLKTQTVYEKIARLDGHGTTSTPHEYVYIDSNVLKGDTYSYKLRLVKTDGSTEWYGPVSATVSGVEPFLHISPNPFRDRVNIEYCIGQSAEGIELKIYDVSGRLVKNLSLGTGHSALTTAVSWDGRDNFGKLLPSGIYFCKLSQGTFTQTKKILLVR